MIDTLHVRAPDQMVPGRIHRRLPTCDQRLKLSSCRDTPLITNIETNNENNKDYFR